MMKMKMEIYVLFVIFALVSQHALGVEVEVYKGEESVLLPCQFAAPIPEGYVIVWRREDLRFEIIHSIVDGNVDLRSQNQRYNNRTSMKDDALKSGELSLTLRNATYTDSGTYTCVTRSGGVDEQKTEVQLKVTERPPPYWHKIVICVLVVVTVLSILYGFCLYRLTKREKMIATKQLTPVEVREGDSSVVMSFITCDVSDISTVEWVHVKDHRKVCVFKDGQILHEEQHKDYKDRTEMNSEALRTGDVSLTLNNPLCADGGVYICNIFHKCGIILRQKIMTLLVKEKLSQSMTCMMANIRLAPTEAECTIVPSSIPLQKPNEKWMLYKMMEGLYGTQTLRDAVSKMLKISNGKWMLSQISMVSNGEWRLSQVWEISDGENRLKISQRLNITNGKWMLSKILENSDGIWMLSQVLVIPDGKWELYQMLQDLCGKQMVSQMLRNSDGKCMLSKTLEIPDGNEKVEGENAPVKSKDSNEKQMLSQVLENSDGNENAEAACLLSDQPV